MFSFRHMLLKIAQCYNYFWHESKRRGSSSELKLSWNNISSLWIIANRVGFQVTLTSCQLERFIEYLYVEEVLLLVETQLIHSPCTWTHACARDSTSPRSGIFVTHYEFKPTSATLCDFLVSSMMRASKETEFILLRQILRLVLLASENTASPQSYIFPVFDLCNASKLHAQCVYL